MSRVSLYYSYIAVSNLLIILTVADAIMTFEQFYEVIVFLTSSRAFGIMLHNGVLANVLLATSIVRKVFFGTLSPIERQHMSDELVMNIFETCVGLIYFQNVINTTFSVAFAATVAFKILHHLASARLESIERSVQRPVGAVRKLTAFLTVSLFIDLYVMLSCTSHMFDSGANIYLLLLLKYSTMALRSLVTQIKLMVYLKEDGNAAPGPIRFYVDITSNFIEGLLHVCSFAAMARVALPLHLVRDLLKSLKNMKDTIHSFVRYRRLATHMDIIFETASSEDLDKDRRCAVCYDDMNDDSGCKKLKCGHCYHKDCLRKWLESNSACPYCRKDIDANLNVPQPRPAANVPQPRDMHAALLAAFAPRNPPPAGVGPAVAPEAAEAAAPEQEDEELIRAAYADYLRMHAAMEAPPAGTVPVVLTRTQIIVDRTPPTIQDLQAQLEAFEEYKAAVDTATCRLESKLLFLRAQTAMVAAAAAHPQPPAQ
jgi:E3 ubiquitin-protein ligase synoviolin